MCLATLYEGICTNMEPFDQGRNLAGVKGPAASQNLENHALTSNFEQIGLGQPMLVHQESQHLAGG